MRFTSPLYSFTDESKEEIEINKDKKAAELLLEAGYVLSPECKKEWHIQKFKKFYAPGEELCTFGGGRLNSCRVWFAVKENVKDGTVMVLTLNKTLN